MACGCCGQKYKARQAQAVQQSVRLSSFRRRTGAVNGIIKAGTVAPAAPAVTPPATETVTPPVEETKE